MLQTKVKVKLTGGIMPVKKSEYAACYDVFCPTDYVIKRGRQVIDLGFVLELPIGWHADIRPRSGFSVNGFECEMLLFFLDGSEPQKTNLRIDADVLLGTIDCDYRNNCGVILVSREKEPDVPLPKRNLVHSYEYIIHKGTRIAQMLIAKDEETELVEVDEVDTSIDRGGGFGHTGA